MRSPTRLAVCAAILGLSVFPSVHAQQSKCRTVQFSDSVLQRFPRAREACLDVITRNGEEYAVFKADLLRVGGQTARMRAKLPDGTHAPAQNIRIDPKRRVLVNGKPVRPDQLAVGQEITAYVKVTEPVLALAPADESEPLATQPLEAADARVASAEDSPRMPTTAGPLPLIGASGLLLLAIGGALGLLRRGPTRRAS
jgi:hypothetical protein